MDIIVSLDLGCMVYAFRMKHFFASFFIPSLLLLSGCGTPTTNIGTGSGSSVPKGESIPAIPAELSRIALASADYTLIDPTVRGELTKANQDFRVSIRGGVFTFPASVLVSHYGTVSVDTENITYGDLTGDGILDAVVRVKAGTDDFATVELAAFTSSGGTAHQFAAFPLGRASVRSVDITAGKIRVNFSHMVPGDPGPRNTELLLELPKK